MAMIYDAFITAGGLLHGEMRERAGTSVKALVKIGEKTLLEGTIDALRGSGSIGRIILIAPGELRDSPLLRVIDHYIEADLNGVENIRKGLEYYSDCKYAVLCSSDLPFITAEAVSDFLARCPETASVCYPVFEKEEIDPAIRPGVPSYIRLKEGHFTGGSIFRLEVARCLESISQIGKSFNARKSAVGMARLLGFSVLLKFFLGTLSYSDLQKRCEEIICAPVALIRGCSAGITIDIDDGASYDFALEYEKKFR